MDAINNIYYLVVCLIMSCIQESFALVATVNPGANLSKNSNRVAELATAKVLSTTTTSLFRNEDEEQHNNENGNSTINVSHFSNIIKIVDEICPSLQDANELTQTQLINRLTAPCRYDRLERPPVVVNGSVINTPVKIYLRVYVYVIQNLETNDLKFKVHFLIQMRFRDPRLQFAKYATNRPQSIMGESSLHNLLWVPHIFLANEHSSQVLGTNEKDILTAISADGTVIVSSRVQSTLYCWMKLQKFPFDEQYCPTVFESWMYNTSELILQWEQKEPVTFDRKMHFTEYALKSVWMNETIVNADLDDLRHGSFVGNYSSLSFTVHLTREVGYYVMDYFLPSIMIVAISWVSFWLQADQTPARTTLGCTTLLSFITLASSQEKNLPKVSYIKVSEVWFLGCTCFIFCSLVEFAFVNTIWRRKHSVEVKKVKSKYIFKSTITPNMKRHKILNDSERDNHEQSNNVFERYLPVTESPVIITVDEETNNKLKSTKSIISQPLSVDDCKSKKRKDLPRNSCWATMTPHEVSLWIDKRARFMFPLAFVVFNALFWTFVYCF